MWARSTKYVCPQLRGKGVDQGDALVHLREEQGAQDHFSGPVVQGDAAGIDKVTV